MRPTLVDEIGGYVFPIGLLGMCGMPLIWAFQIFHWLRWGEWLPISVDDALRWAGSGEPHFAWRGVQKVADFLLTAPLSVAIFFLSLGLLLLFMEISERLPIPGTKVTPSTD